MPRPEALDDSMWLRDVATHQSARAIARQLGCAPGTVSAAFRDAEIEPAASNRSRRPAVAEELGIPAITVNKALHRHDIALEGSWVRRDTTRLERPPDRQLASVWDEHHTIRAVALQFSVAPTTAAVWLARAGIFVNDVPVLSRAQLEAAIAEGLPLRQIAERHHVGQRTVTVELIRHDLLEQHRHRPS